MRDGVRIVNAARGELVDEAALVRGADARARSRARRSTSSREEPYAGPLLELDNVVATPHLAASTDEAQDRAGVIVAEQVVAALDGGLVTNAVNIPVIGAEDLEVLGPYVPLAAELGRLAMELAEGRASRIAARVLRPARRLRHAAAHRRRAERRLPGAQRAAGQLRERADDRRRARDRRSRRRSSAVARLHEPVAVAVDDFRVAGTTIGSEQPPLARLARSASRSRWSSRRCSSSSSTTTSPA